MNPTAMYSPLWPKTTRIGSQTRHQDQCTAAVSFKTANTRQRNPHR